MDHLSLWPSIWPAALRSQIHVLSLPLPLSGLIVTSALMIWKSLMLITGSESPVRVQALPPPPVGALFHSCELMVLQVVVVLSGSMEPGFYRGDILFLKMGKARIRTGEIVVFNLDGRDIPIVHRVIKVHERDEGGHTDILTKVRALLLCCHLCAPFLASPSSLIVITAGGFSS